MSFLQKVSVLFTIASGCVVAGCTGAETNKPDTPTPTSATHTDELQFVEINHPHRVPLVVAVKGPENPQPGDIVTVTATVTRNLKIPYEYRLVLPEGARLLEGQAQSREEAQLGEKTYEFRIAIDKVPDKDFVVEVTSAGANYGVRGTDAYRFGRPEPRMITPRRGELIRTRAGDWGTPVELSR